MMQSHENEFVPQGLVLANGTALMASISELTAIARGSYPCGSLTGWYQQ